jgi:uncharacterized flavoprotein (TIGR03862 family)
MIKVVIVGAGPCGLFTAFQLLKNPKIIVELYDKQKSAGNKFLVAGKSGLNLTHSGTIDEFCQNYYGDSNAFSKWLNQFNNDDLVKWANELGVETFVGSSGRVFPKEFKAAQMLKLWTEELKKSKNFSFFPNSSIQHISENSNSVTINEAVVDYDQLVLALGGGSWAKTGSDGVWSSLFKALKVQIDPFYSMNCGFNVNWSETFMKEFEILPIKYISIKHGDNQIKGDAMLTPWGIEGTPIYSLTHSIQNQLLENPDVKPVVFIDLKPDLDRKQLAMKLKGKKSISTKLKSVLSEGSILLLRELTTKEEYLNEDVLIDRIKKLPMSLEGTRPIDEAISTGGGVNMKEISKKLSLIKYPNIYIGGEMLAWNAPTGGYLLQGCFTQGFVIADSISKKATH